MLRTSLTQLMAIIVPTCIGAAVAAPTVVPVILGKQWTAAIPVYRALCGVAMLDASMQMLGIQLEVFSLFRRRIYLQLLFIVLWVTAILLTVRFGITAVALAYCVMQLLRSLIFHWISAKSLQMSLWALVSCWTPAIACSGVIATALGYLQSILYRQHFMGLGLQLVLLIASGGTLSVLFYWMFFRETVFRPWIELLDHDKTPL